MYFEKTVVKADWGKWFMVFDSLPVPALHRGNNSRGTKNKGGKIAGEWWSLSTMKSKPLMGCQIICHTVACHFAHLLTWKRYIVIIQWSADHCVVVWKGHMEKKGDQVICSERKWSNGNRWRKKRSWCATAVWKLNRRIDCQVSWNLGQSQRNSVQIGHYRADS